MFGADANWGRILCAMGYSGESFDPENGRCLLRLQSGIGRRVPGRARAGLRRGARQKGLLEDEVTIDVTLHAGDAQVTAWGCDLTYDYVKINGDYRT